MENCDPRFEPLLEKFDTDAFELCDSTTYGLWPDFTLAYLNRAWFKFAAANGAEHEIRKRWGLGTNALLAMDEPLRGYYKTALTGCLEDGKPWGQDYVCPSATIQRKFYMRAYPLQHDRGLLVVHSRVLERTHNSPTAPAIEEFYTNDQGFIVQCMHCRLVQRCDHNDQWDMVPTWVAQRPENTTGGLCPPCFAHYFGK
tara:strand:- start:8415 stop:9011 length:597 start_codon:yes stop_codon:yes gene_type:complete